MPSDSGSRESRPDLVRRIREANEAALARLAEGPRQPDRISSLADLKEHIKQRLLDEGVREPLTPEEQDRIADGEPYCFRCGKPASSFEEYRQDCVYDDPDCGGNCAVDYVKDEEGTYNPETNRFACDACYIAIGMPVEETGSHNYGWRAP